VTHHLEIAYNRLHAPYIHIYSIALRGVSDIYLLFNDIQNFPFSKELSFHIWYEKLDSKWSLIRDCSFIVTGGGLVVFIESIVFENLTPLKLKSP